MFRPAFVGATFTLAVGDAQGCTQSGYPQPCTHPDGSSVSGFFQNGSSGALFYEPVFMGVHGINSDWAGANSLHAGGCQFLFADGSVQFLSQNMNWVMYNRLCGKSEGLPASY